MTLYYERDGITLYHADCLDVLPTLEAVDMVLTDPPYGVSYQSDFREATPKFARLHGDCHPQTDWFRLLPALLAPGGAAYVFTRWDVYPEWKAAIEEVWRVRNCIVWVKERGGLGDPPTQYWNQHEFLLYITNGRHELRGMRQGNVWSITGVSHDSYLHPTQKPVALCERAILKSSDPGELILDPFAGSGTTGVAAFNLGRRAILIEREEKYCEVAAKRLESLTPPLFTLPAEKPVQAALEATP